MEDIRGFSGQYRFLSNFFPCAVSFCGLTFHSVEAAFQSAKCRTDKERRVFAALTPQAAKQLGRTVVLSPDWEAEKEPIMRQLLLEKFKGNPELGDKLLATGDKQLIEANVWHDNYWGDCICSICDGTPGKNRLGQLLMDVRAELRDAAGQIGGADAHE